MQARKRKSARTTRPREGTDPQQQAVYDWEEEWYDWRFNTLTLKSCREISDRVCRAYGIATPRIRSTRTEAAACYCEEDLIVLQSTGLLNKTKGNRKYGAKNLASLLHELAHYITYKVCAKSHHDHGPAFMGVFLYLLADGKVAPREALYKSARARGLRWYKGSPKEWGAVTCKT